MSWDGRMYKKYRVQHMDGTPLKGKNYFVLRLDSDNPAEAARVNAAMRAYTGRLRNCDVGTADERYRRWIHFCEQRLHKCDACPCNRPEGCTFTFEDMPYAEEGDAK